MIIFRFRFKKEVWFFNVENLENKDKEKRIEKMKKMFT